MEPSVDTLGRWMAHYIAELIKMAEDADNLNERSKAQEKCFETILKLWEHRLMLPHGARPLANLEGVLKAIENLQGQKTPRWVFSTEEVEVIGGPWLWFAKEVEEAGLRMCRLAVLTAIAEASLGNDKRWVLEHGEMLSKEETTVIQVLDSWLSAEMLWQTKKEQISVGELEPEDRNRLVVEEIMASIKQLNSSSESLLSKVQQ